MEDERGFEIIDHPSDIGIKITSKTAEGLFEQAAAGMFSLMVDLHSVKPAVAKSIDIYREEDLKIEDLLLIWLEELIYFYEVNNMLFSRFKVIKIISEYYNHDNKIKKKKANSKESILVAKIYGEKIDFNKHEIFVSVKAPTYHMLEVAKNNRSGLWKGQVIFDV